MDDKLMKNGKSGDNSQTVIEDDVDQAIDRQNLVFRGIYLIVVTALMFGVFGGITGWLLALVTPAYFRNAFDAMDSEVWQIGVGLGITRGLACGVFVGAVVLLAAAWYRSRITTAVLRHYREQSD